MIVIMEPVKTERNDAAHQLKLDGIVYFSLGLACDNACLHCVAEHRNVDTWNSRENMNTCEVVSYFDRISGNKNLTLEISGGEPTIRNDFLYLMEYLSINAPWIKKILLTNGRSFSNADFTSRAALYPPECSLVPLHAHEPKLHDMITRRAGSFNETVLGIRNMFEYGMMVIPKIVANRLNYKILPDFVEFVAQNFPEAKTVGIDTMDVSGAAEMNKDRIAVKHSTVAPYMEKAMDTAVKYGMHVNAIYMPFCLVGEKYRQYIWEGASIVMYKDSHGETVDIRGERGVVEACGECRYIGRCPGSWFTYFKEFGAEELKPVV
ncbi:MAG: radical SAM protein [archaeon]